MKKLGLVLIIVGALIAGIPVYQQAYDYYMQQKMMAELGLEGDVTDELNDLGGVFDSLNNQDDAAENDNIVFDGLEEFEDAAVQSQTSKAQPDQSGTAGNLETTTKAPTQPAIKLKVLGIVEVPGVKIKLPLVEGTEEKDLVRSAGHMPGTDMPGEIGNSVIAGHRGYSEGRLFNRLDEVKIGDIVRVKTKAGTFEYEVYETKIVEPTDLSVLNRNDKDRVLTLITCTPMFKSTHRIIIHAVMR